MKKHDQLKKDAIKAINQVFSDTSVTPETTRDSLEEIASEIKMLLDTIHEQ